MPTGHAHADSVQKLYTVITEYAPGQITVEHFPTRRARRNSLIERAEHHFHNTGCLPETMLDDEQGLAGLVAAFLHPATGSLAEATLGPPAGRSPSAEQIGVVPAMVDLITETQDRLARIHRERTVQNAAWEAEEHDLIEQLDQLRTDIRPVYPTPAHHAAIAEAARLVHADLTHGSASFLGDPVLDDDPDEPYAMVEVFDDARGVYLSHGIEVRRITDDRDAEGWDAVLSIARGLIAVSNDLH